MRRSSSIHSTTTCGRTMKRPLVGRGPGEIDRRQPELTQSHLDGATLPTRFEVERAESPTLRERLERNHDLDAGPRAGSGSMPPASGPSRSSSAIVHGLSLAASRVSASPAQHG